METILNGIGQILRPGREISGTEARAGVDTESMGGHAAEASSFLKALGHEGRLMILCHLAGGEKSVTELERLLHSRQASVSQQLARLRLEGLVSYRREGKTIYYSLASGKARQTIELLYQMFCAPAEDAEISN